MAGSTLNCRRMMAATLLSTAMFAGIATADYVKPATSNHWRIHVNGSAKSEGTITLRLTPIDGVATDFRATIKKGRGENGIADDIVDALKATFDKKAYSSETDDGEEVLIKKRGKSKNFAIQLIDSTVEGVRLDFDKE